MWKPGEEMVHFVAPTCAVTSRCSRFSFWQNLDLLDETRTLVHTGRLLRQSEGNFELSGWTDTFVLLFDNYREFSFRRPCNADLIYLVDYPVVMTKPKEKDGITKYHVVKRVRRF